MAEKVTAAVIYKSLLENESVSENLSSLVNQAEDFSSKISDYDVIKEYLQLSGNCQEILQLVKELSSSDSQNVVVLMKALCYILIRLASDMNLFIATGTSIVNEILAYGMKTIFNFMKLKQKSSRTKLALHLLASMVAIGNQTAQLVVAKLDFSNVSFTHLLNRTNFSEDEDVRTAFLNLIVLIMNMCNNNVIRQIVEVKGFLNHIFPGLISDRVTTITLVLKTLQQHIIENQNVPKPNKVRLFNDNTLKSVIQLYTWKGPLRKDKFKKRKLGQEPDPVAFEVSEEEFTEVRTCAHEFMLSLLSHKNGIIFRDPACGVSGRNFNYTITNVLKYFLKPYANPLASEFVISVLKACPDQLRNYLQVLKDSFAPRLSPSWVNAVKFLKEVMESQDVISSLFKSESKKPLPALLSIAKTFCLLDILSVSEVIEVFAHGHHVLCYYLCDFLLSILNQAKSILDFCLQCDISKIPYDSADMSSFYKSFLAVITQSLPVGKELENYWNKITTGVEETMEEYSQEELSVPTLYEEMSAVLKVMKRLQELSSKSSNDFNFDLLHMMHNLKECSNLLPQTDISKLYINMMDLLTAEECNSLWNKKHSESPLMAICEVYVSNHKSKDVSLANNFVFKVLLHTKVFDKCEWEINVWLEALASAKSRHISFLFEFISAAMYTLLQQPSKFAVPRNEERQSTSQVPKIDNSDDENFEDSEGDKKQSISCNQKKCFSNFASSALFTLQTLDESKTKGCHLFVEKALIHIMHCQHSPHVFFNAIKQYRSVINPSSFDYWQLLSCPKTEIQAHFDNLCSGDNNCSLDLTGHLKQNFMSCHVADSSDKSPSCKISSMIKEVNSTDVTKVMQQLLTYIDFELTLILMDEHQDSNIVSYTKFLEKLLDSLLLNADEICGNDKNGNEPPVQILPSMKILEENLNHPILLKLFLGVGNTPSKASRSLKKCVCVLTKMILNIAQKFLHLEDKIHLCLLPFKQKVVAYLQVKENCETPGFDLVTVIGTFSPLFSIKDIKILIETMLHFESCDLQDVDEIFPSLCLLLKTFLERKDFVLLSQNSINSFISSYVGMPKKRKKIFREYLLQLLESHPAYALLLYAESSHLLMHHRTLKDLPLFGKLIDSSGKFKCAIQAFLSETTDDSNGLDFLYLTSKCLSNSVPEDKFYMDFKNSLFSRYWSALVEYIFEDITADADILKQCFSGKTIQMLLFEKYPNPKKFNDFCKLTLEKSKGTTISSSKMFIILQILGAYKLYKLEKKETSLLILKITLHWLYSTVSKDFSSWELTDFLNELLQSFDDIDIEVIIEDLGEFFSKTLKVALKFEDIGKKILKVLALLCEKSNVHNLPVQSIYNLVTGHSSFFSVMLSEKIETNSFKECLIDLLISLTTLDGSVCKENHLSLYLSSYGATLTSVDQKLLFLMKLYSDNGINMIKYSPFLWGKPAIVHYSVMNKNEMYLWKQPKLQDVLSTFLPEKIDSTVLNYPLKATLQPSLVLLEVDETLSEQVYDLRFILPLLSVLLSPGSFVHCHKFVESRVLMLIFTSLSSLDAETRALGYHCLFQLYQQLEGANYREKGIWLCLLDSLRNSINSPNPKLPKIISLFLAKAADIFTKPDHNLYVVIYKFIMVKPCLDVGQVPEFYKLFNSIELEHRIHRLWLLNLLADGLQTSLDFHICEKRYIFSSLLVHYFSSLSTNQEKLAILRLLCSAVKIESSSNTLCQNGLLPWLHNVLKQSEAIDSEIFKSLCYVMKNLQSNVTDHHHFAVVHLSLLEHIKVAGVHTQKYYFSTLLETLTLLKNSSNPSVVNPTLSLKYIEQLHELLKTLKEDLRYKESELQDIKSSDVPVVIDCIFMLSKIITFWEPMFTQDMPREFQNTQLKIIVNTLDLTLQTNNDSFYFCNLPDWLLKCAAKDTEQGFLQMLLSPEGNKSLVQIIKLFEKSLSLEKCRSREPLCDVTPGKSSNNSWRDFLLHFKSLSNYSDISESFQMVKQIIDVI